MYLNSIIETKLLYSDYQIWQLYYYTHQFFDNDYPKEVLIEADGRNFEDSFNKRMKRTKIQKKYNSIKLLDITVRYPFDPSDNQKLDEWKKKSVEYFSSVYGKENILGATYHPFGTPHIHFAVMPVHRNRLSWSHYNQNSVRIPQYELGYFNTVLGD